ncbi:hypothetical protein AT238_06345 [Bartonella henselae]|nr:hypothetical protein AT238_06345 [Bartonella henselae]PNM39055.1 hypothetical protein AL470_007225 [Bartonella henselae str. Houston-1]
MLEYFIFLLLFYYEHVRKKLSCAFLRVKDVFISLFGTETVSNDEKFYDNNKKTIAIIKIHAKVVSIKINNFYVLF